MAAKTLLYDEDARRGHSAGRGHHHWKGATKLGCRIDDGLIAREVRLAGQHIHRLGAGDTRHQLHRHRCDIVVRVGIEIGARAIGIKHPDQKHARL